MRDVSVPAFGSVTPNDMTISPVAIRGRYFRLSASEPCLITGIGGDTEKRRGAGPGGPAPGGRTPGSDVVAPGRPRPRAPRSPPVNHPPPTPPREGFAPPP